MFLCNHRTFLLDMHWNGVLKDSFNENESLIQEQKKEKDPDEEEEDDLVEVIIYGNSFGIKLRFKYDSKEVHRISIQRTCYQPIQCFNIFKYTGKERPARGQREKRKKL